MVTAYLVAYINTRSQPPFVNYIGTFSESARNLTMTGDRVCAVDIVSAKGETFEDAIVNLLAYVKCNQFLEWTKPFLSYPI